MKKELKKRNFLAHVLFSLVVMVLALAFTSSDVSAAERTGLKKTNGAKLSWEDFEKMKEASENEDSIDSVGSRAYDSEWDVYSTNYYYNFLNANEKAFWDELDASSLNLLLNKTSTYYSQGSYWIIGGRYHGFTESRAEEIFYLFKYSNPQYYFLDVQPDFKGNTLSMSIISDFGRKADRTKATKDFKKNIKAVVSEIKKQSTDLEKIKYAHDWICDNILYNYDDMDAALNQVAYSVLRDNRDYTVCAGYSQTFMLLMNAVGIDCAVQTSSYEEDGEWEGHEWNIVKYNGNWYYMDVTWDDGYDEHEWDYGYFNRSFEVIEDKAHTAEEMFYGMIPESVYDSRASYDPSDYPAAPTAVCQAPVISYKAGKATISVPSGYQVVYTIDGVTPEEGYARGYRIKKKTTIDAPASGVIKAATIRDGYNNSETVTCKYNVYKVTLKDSKKNGTKAYVPEGAKLKGYSKIKAKGYTFGGWYTNKSHTKEFSLKTPVTEDITIYAKWTANKYEYTFKANGEGAYIGKNRSSSLKKTFTYDKTYKGLPTAKRSDYVFLGWFTKKHGGELISASDTVRKTKNITIYAHWGKLGTKQAAIKGLVSKNKGALTVKIKKISNANGYQIMYSTKASMTGAKRTKTSDTATSKTITKLKSEKTYYVKVRMYQKDSVTGKVSYGSWSTRKKIKVK